MQTDRAALETRQVNVDDFIEELATKIWDLTCHYYIPKHQAQQLKSIKKNLEIGEVVILMDSAENYSFIVQDSIQGFHCENSQATLHPFVVYYKEANEV